MKILALESSAAAASVAVCEDEELIAQSLQRTGLTHSATLLPMLEDLLKNAGLALRDMDLLAVAAVPERSPSSCPPPVSSGRSRTPFLTYSAPMPLGAPILWPLTAIRSAPSFPRGSGVFKKPCTPSQWNKMAGS